MNLVDVVFVVFVVAVSTGLLSGAVAAYLDARSLARAMDRLSRPRSRASDARILPSDSSSPSDPSLPTETDQ